MALAPPNPIDVTFELVTPAYAGGADRERTDGLRPPTLKALLRFWWRTMHPEMSSRDLFEAEGRLFGSTEHGQGIRLKPNPPTGSGWPRPLATSVGTEVNDTWHVYAAYGAVAWGNGAQRRNVPEIPPSPQTSWTFRIMPPGNASAWNASDRSDIEKTLWLITAFGGFGSRNRRGWGGLRVRYEWSSLQDPHSSTDVVLALKQGLTKAIGVRSGIRIAGSGSRAAHTAFTGGTNCARVLVGPPSASAEAALKSLVEPYHEYRKRLGRNYPRGPVGSDYNKRRNWATRGIQPRDALTEGSAFGLPNDARFRSLGGALVKVGSGPTADGRRASPVFFKVVGSGNSYRPVLLWLPTEFLPGGTDITVNSGGHAAGQVTYPGDGAIATFIDELTPPNWQEVTW